jgi:hypothetical protein
MNHALARLAPLNRLLFLIVFGFFIVVYSILLKTYRPFRGISVWFTVIYLALYHMEHQIHMGDQYLI